ncbi:MAG: hypothetical protein WCL53_01250 [Chloroflexota bacterium]
MARFWLPVRLLGAACAGVLAGLYVWIGLHWLYYPFDPSAYRDSATAMYVILAGVFLVLAGFHGAAAYRLVSGRGSSPPALASGVLASVLVGPSLVGGALGLVVVPVAAFIVVAALLVAFARERRAADS